MRRATGSRRLLSTLAVGASAVSPFVLFGGMKAALDTPRFAALLLAAVAALVAWAAGAVRMRALPRPLVIAVAAACGVIVAAGVAAPQSAPALTFGAEASLMGAPAWLALLVVFAVAAATPLTEGVRRAVLAAVVLGTVSAVVGLWERVSHGRVAGGFGNADYFGTVAVMLLPVALVAVHGVRSRNAGRAFGVSAVVLLAATLLSGSVTVAVAAVLSLVALFSAAPQTFGISAEARRAFVRANRGRVVAVAAVVGLAGVAGAAGPVTQALTGATAQTRYEMWEIAWKAFASRPVLGQGPDGLWTASQAYLSETLLRLEGAQGVGTTVLVRDPHALPLLALVSFGVIGLAVGVWLGVSWLRLVVTRSREGAGRVVRIAYAIGAVGFLACMMLIPWSIRFAALPALLAGLAVAPSGSDAAEVDSRAEERATLRVAVLAARVGAPLFAVAFTTLALAGVVGDVLFDRALASSGRAAAVRVLESAAAWQPTRAEIRYELLYARGVGVVSGDETAEAYAESVDGAGDLIQANGVYLANLAQPMLDARILGVSGSGETWARATIERAARYAPLHPDVILEQAHLALVDGDLSGARTHLELAERVGVTGGRLVLYRYLLATAEGDVAAAESFRSALAVSAPYLLDLVP